MSHENYQAYGKTFGHDENLTSLAEDSAFKQLSTSGLAFVKALLEEFLALPHYTRILSKKLLLIYVRIFPIQ